MMKIWRFFGYLSSLVMLFIGAGVLTDAGAAPIVIDEETRTVKTDLITVQWDVNVNERILHLELNSAPGVNLTTHYGGTTTISGNLPVLRGVASVDLEGRRYHDIGGMDCSRA